MSDSEEERSDVDDESSGDDELVTTSAKKSKKSKNSVIDDLAQESGSDADSDEEEEEDGDNNYVHDGFVVDEDEESGEEDDDDERGNDRKRKRKRVKHRNRLKKKNNLDVLDEDDLDLLRESQGRGPKVDHDGELFDGDDDSDDGRRRRASKKGRRDNFDEDDIDDFIEDDLHDGRRRRGGNRGRREMDDDMDEEEDIGGVATGDQLAEASDIFGTEYLQFLQGATPAVDSEQGVDGEEDDDLFKDDVVSDDPADEGLFESSDDDDADADASGSTRKQRDEAARLRRERKKHAAADRRRRVAARRAEKRKAQLRRAFEPVLLVENFCTEKDDLIRSEDGPERFFGLWKEAAAAATDAMEDEDTENRDRANWIMSQVPDIAAEYIGPPPTAALRDEDAMDEDEEDDNVAAVKPHQQAILDSIVNALRYMKVERLEPEFIGTYRADTVTSSSVRNNLYAVVDADSEYDRLRLAREKAAGANRKFERMAPRAAQQGRNDQIPDDDQEDVARKLLEAQGELDEAVLAEERTRNQLETMGDGEIDADEAFGLTEDEIKVIRESKLKVFNAKKAQLKNFVALVQSRSERVAHLTTLASQTHSELSPTTISRLCHNTLWNPDYGNYLKDLTELREVKDTLEYFQLVAEGHDAAISKGKTAADGDTSGLLMGGAGKNKRSRRSDRDYYRTCVAEGQRNVAYKFLLSPIKVGIKVDDLVNHRSIDYNRQLPGTSGDDAEGSVNPRDWMPPALEDNPETFANELYGSGELVVSADINKNDSDYQQKIKDPNYLLRGARYVAAMELAYEPRVRKAMRKIYMEKAVLSTTPTAKGKEEIDFFHPNYGIHLIKEKPIATLSEETLVELVKRVRDQEERNRRESKTTPVERYDVCQYLRIILAERSKQIKSTVHLKTNARGEPDLSPFLQVLEQATMSPHQTEKDWINQRRQILIASLTKFMLPSFEKEATAEMARAASRVGIIEASNNFRKIAMEGSYRPVDMAGDNPFINPTGDLPIVGISVGTDPREATYLAAVNANGELIENLPIPSGQTVHQLSDKVVTFLEAVRPSAVVIGTGGGKVCNGIMRAMNMIIHEATQKWNNRFIQRPDEDDEDFDNRKSVYRHSNFDDEDEVWRCNADLVFDGVSQLFGRSIRGRKEFPDLEVNLRISISLARFAKNPLAELCSTWTVASDAGTFGTETLYMNIHPLQSALPKKALLKEYERVLCAAVPQVGVDINDACAFNHLHGMLQFVPGLGPRKAMALKQGITRVGGVIETRKSLLQRRLMGPTVYNNAVAFLRIRDRDKLEGKSLHVLDDTRLHPDVYHRNTWAMKIAIDALDQEVPEDGIDGSMAALREVMMNSQLQVRKLFEATVEEWEAHCGPDGDPFNAAVWNPRIDVPSERWQDKIEDLDLEAFAEMLEQDGYGKWFSHLEMIKWEFRLPYQDPRPPMEQISGSRKFELLTGEDDSTLRPGKEVTGRITKIGNYGCNVKLDFDLNGFIPIRNIADQHIQALEDHVKVGQIVVAVITEVKKDFLTVDLSMRKHDLYDRKITDWPRPESLPPLDHNFDYTRACGIESDRMKKRREIMIANQPSNEKNKNMVPKPKLRMVYKRTCVHPSFRNASHKNVVDELLASKDIMTGEALIRPSTQSTDSLSLYWLIHDGVYKVWEITEENKDTETSIGNILKIKVCHVMNHFCQPS
mmetsp:Transcript_20399/g.46293  ORF Transcript_20399/g.46293 Transcript_20399/m.46293 type:complete len:1687 (-) Transcript_20399:27-5087(-)